MNADGIKIYGELTVEITRADGTREAPQLKGPAREVTAKLAQPRRWYEKLWRTLTKERVIQTMSFSSFLLMLMSRHTDAAYSLLNPKSLHGLLDLTTNGLLGMVTSAGTNYLATTFTSNASPLINFNYHDMGTGVVQGSTNNLASPFASNATPIVITETAHGRNTNDLVRIAGVTGNTAANADWQILVINANTYSLYGSAGNGTAGGTPTAQRINGLADTALTTPAGTARVAGAQTNPAANQYKTIATITNNTAGSLAITEWGLFSASSNGTMWDRRYFNTGGGGNAAPATQATQALVASPSNLNVGDSLQNTYTVTFTYGGS